MSLLVLLSFAAGLVLLLLGAEFLVRGASRLALSLGLTPIVVGLTVVAIGTSTPELAVSLGGALNGSAGIALGNVVGSNIANVLLILGLVALISPLLVHRQLVRLDVPVMIAASLACLALAADGNIARWEGALLVVAAAVYIGFLLRTARRHPEHVPPDPELQELKADTTAPASGGTLRNAAWMLLGLIMLVGGAQLLVQAATQTAKALGLSDLVIGLTVVAIGTSLPEIATSVLSALRGQRDLAVGNIVGSNIFNILLVLGATALLAPGGIPVDPAAIRFDIPVLIVVAVACLPIFFKGHCIDRWEGALFLAYYAAYVAYLLLAASDHDALQDYRRVMTTFVLPLTALTLVVVAWHGVRAHRNNSSNGAKPG